MQVALEEFQHLVSEFGKDLPPPDARYSIFRLRDPYPDIPPALLSAGHLASYAITTGMIDEFEVDGSFLKPATYLIPIEGPVRYRDDDGRLQSFYLTDGPPTQSTGPDVRPEFELKRNSLVYVTLKPTFRLPAYLAGRFNLTIRDVYRGLIVGTGPLVDPGFVGRLSIPIHNFTNNRYVLRAGEGFVYFEFTKLSWKNPHDSKPTPDWVRAPIDVQPPFPVSKQKRRKLDDYLDAATGGGPAQNAVVEEVTQLRSTSQAISERSEDMSRRFRAITLAGTIGVFIGIASVVVSAFAAWLTALQVYEGAQQFTLSAQSDVSDSYNRLSQQVTALRAELEDTKRNLQEVRGRLLLGPIID